MVDRFQHSNLPVSQNEIINPLCILFVKSGSKGDRLLFRYPYKLPETSPGKEVKVVKSIIKFSPTESDNKSPQTFSDGISSSRRHNFIFRRQETKSPQEPSYRRHNPNPYAIRKDFEDEITGISPEQSQQILRKSNISMDLSNEDLSNLLAVNMDLSERKFELKVNDVRFVGHPTLMQHSSIVRPINPASLQSSTKLFHIVFCLNAMASHSIVKCFYDLSKRLGIALRHEEYRVAYLSKEMKTIIQYLDEASQEHEEDNNEVDQNYFQHAFQNILKNSSLARLLKATYDDVCATGFVKLRVNNWIQISFCLPQKIHVIPYRDSTLLVEPENIHKCLESIRPYHALLLLVDREELAASISLDASSTIPRLLQVYSPLKSLQVIAADADLSLSQVVEVASHLVYWAMATVIYPMCETNVYVMAPDVPITSQEMEDAFSNAFPGLSLTQTLADFSLPMPLGERANPVLGGSYLQAQLVQLVCWLLQYRLLIQLHTYIYLTTYLDDNGIENSLSNGGYNLGIMEIRPYEHDGEDDITVSDSYSETAEELPQNGNENNGVAAAVAAIPEESKNETVVSGGPFEETGGDTVDGGGGSDEKPSADDLKETMKELSEIARRAIESVKPELPIADIKLFGRLSKYFNGEYHFEEIMYRENVRRSQLLLLLDKLRDVLITSEREDSAINFFKFEQW